MFKYKNNSMSVVLIIANLIVVFIYLNCTHTTENQDFYNIIIFFMSLTLLLAGHVFTYRGIQYRLNRRIFYISLIITVLLVAFLLFMLGLGSGFQH